MGEGEGEGATPLLAAIERGHVAAVAALLSDCAADPDAGSARTSAHQSPLLLSVSRGCAECARELLRHNATCVHVQFAAKRAPEPLIAVARTRRDGVMMRILSDHCADAQTPGHD